MTMTCLISSAYSAQITCQFNGDTCDVVSATPVTRPNEVITVSGMPTNYINTATKMIKYNGAKLAFVPNGACRIFPNLNAISMMNCYTTKLLKDSFSICSNLMSMQIVTGNVPIIPAGVAQTSSKLMFLAFVQTNTVKIDRSALIGLTNLQSLSLSNNKIACVPFDLFQNTPNLVFIDFSANRITALDINLFKNLQLLQQANFANNMITSLPYFELSTTSIHPMSSDLNLNFDYNQIRSINPNICGIINTRLAVHKMTKINILNTPCQNMVPYIDSGMCRQSGYLQACYNNWRQMPYNPIRC